MYRILAFSLLAVALLAGCASAPVPAPVVNGTTPLPEMPVSAPVVDVAPVPVLPPVAVPVRPAPRPVAAYDEREGLRLLDRLLPARVRDREGWRTDIFGAFRALKLPYTAEQFCAAMAVIEQESTWQSDPVVPGLPRIVWGKIEDKADSLHLPMPLVRAALHKSSPDGRSYTERIDSLRTEKEMNALYEDLSAEARNIGLPMSMKNPIRTGGPMQVSVEFAEGHASVWPYPYARRGSWRQEVFSRRGGLYFGIANLLQYPAPYSRMIYRFADYNAGRFSSRNAAFQNAVSRLSGRALVADGDLLTYVEGEARPGSSTHQALRTLAGRLGMTDEAILRDLKLEKHSSFGNTVLYQRLYALADRSAGTTVSREALPQIDLKSPKITRRLTTEWFARRVDGRYTTCLARQ